MRSDETVINDIDEAFGGVERPEHFTNYLHCRECREHDELLLSRNRETLCIEDVGNPGWDPICFTAPEGIAYFFPSLARLALAESDYEHGWYADQLLFHLNSGFEENGFYRWCSPSQRAAVAGFLAHLIESRPDLLNDYGCTEDVLLCHQLWDDTKPLAPRTTAQGACS